MRLWGCESVRLWGIEVFRLWGIEDVRLLSYEFVKCVRLWGKTYGTIYASQCVTSVRWVRRRSCSDWQVMRRPLHGPDMIRINPLHSGHTVMGGGGRLHRDICYTLTPAGLEYHQLSLVPPRLAPPCHGGYNCVDTAYWWNDWLVMVLNNTPSYIISHMVGWIVR